MLRQGGLAVGVAVLVAVIGTPARVDPLSAFRHGWFAVAAFALLGAAASLILRPPAVRGAVVVAEPAGERAV